MLLMWLYKSKRKNNEKTTAWSWEDCDFTCIRRESAEESPRQYCCGRLQPIVSLLLYTSGAIASHLKRHIAFGRFPQQVTHS